MTIIPIKRMDHEFVYKTTEIVYYIQKRKKKSKVSWKIDIRL